MGVQKSKKKFKISFLKKKLKHSKFDKITLVPKSKNTIFTI